MLREPEDKKKDKKSKFQNYQKCHNFLEDILPLQPALFKTKTKARTLEPSILGTKLGACKFLSDTVPSEISDQLEIFVNLIKGVL